MFNDIHSENNDHSDNEASPFGKVEIPANALRKRIRQGLLLIGVLTPILLTVGWFSGKFEALVDQLLPVKTPVNGRITLDGQPLTVGFIRTISLDSGMQGTLAGIESDGTFQLMTNGDPGAYSGRHRVVVVAMTKTFPPKSLIPDHYTKPETSPLTIAVPRQASTKPIELRLVSSTSPNSEKPSIKTN